MDDHELLREYVESRSERAFAGLVAQELPLVYGTALRVLRDPAAAEDVAQMVFIQLSRKAWMVRAGALPGWLYRATLRTALNHQRGEHRRRRRETDAMNLTDQNHDSAAAWERLAPLLDEALGRLPRVEQDALLLRYFKGCSMDETGRRLSLSEPAAQKRVSRALEKLRVHFARDGVVASAALLSSVLGTHAAEPPPAGLAARINTNPLPAATGGAGLAHLAWRILSMTTKSKLLVLATLVVAVIAATVFETVFSTREKTAAPALASKIGSPPSLAPPLPSPAPAPSLPAAPTPATTPAAPPVEIAPVLPPPALASPVVPNTASQASLNTMIPEIVQLIQSDDYVTLLTKYAPPSVIAPLLRNIPPAARTQFAQTFILQMAKTPGFKEYFDQYAAVLKTIGTAPPVYQGNLAVFKSATTPDGTPVANINFVKVNGLWYFDIKMTADAATGRVGFDFNSSVPDEAP